MELAFTARLWRFEGDAAWHFVTLPAELADDVRERAARRAFGSVPVTATVGEFRWTTSLFPDSRSGSYVLPVKAAARTANDVAEGDPVSVRLELR